MDLCASLFLPWQSWEKEAQNQTPKTLGIRLHWGHCNLHARDIKCKPARKYRLKTILSPSEEKKEYTEFSAKTCVKEPKYLTVYKKRFLINSMQTWVLLIFAYCCFKECVFRFVFFFWEALGNRGILFPLVLEQEISWALQSVLQQFCLSCKGGPMCYFTLQLENNS